MATDLESGHGEIRTVTPNCCREKSFGVFQNPLGIYFFCILAGTYSLAQERKSPVFPEIRLLNNTSPALTMGSMPAKGRPYPPGVHVPSLTWFEGTSRQEIDWTVQKRHLEFLVKSDIHGSKFRAYKSMWDVF